MGRPKEAKDYINEDVGRLPKKFQSSVALWNVKRIKRTFNIYKMAVERLDALIKGPFWFKLLISTSLSLSVLRDFEFKESGCMVLRVCINTLIHCSRGELPFNE